VTLPERYARAARDPGGSDSGTGRPPEKAPVRPVPDQTLAEGAVPTTATRPPASHHVTDEPVEAPAGGPPRPVPPATSDRTIGDWWENEPAVAVAPLRNIGFVLLVSTLFWAVLIVVSYLVARAGDWLAAAWPA
jgi:hypothetical protein